MFKIEDICKKCDERIALDAVSMEVPKGSIFGLLDPSGAGKTSPIRTINQIVLPDIGEVWLDGELLQPKHTTQIGCLPEERSLHRSMKVGEQTLYLARLRGLSREETKKQLRSWFDRLQIGGWWHKKVQGPSKSMAQKIQFLVTVLHKPKLLIFDEPFSSFDSISASIIKDEIFCLHEQRATIIFSTHRVESIEELCDHIALINRSHKILGGSLSDMKGTFKNNTYEVGSKVVDEQKAVILNGLRDKYTVQEAPFRTLYDELKLNIQERERQSANGLLQYLNTQGEVTHFVEAIPTANEIFMRACGKLAN